MAAQMPQPCHPEELMRICFTSDLHGRLELYDQLAALLRAEKPQLLILGGDMHIDAEGDDAARAQVAWLHSHILPRMAAWRAAQPDLAIACILGNHDWAYTCAALEDVAAQNLLIMLRPDRLWRCNGLAFLGFSHTPPTPFWVKDFERLDLRTDAVPNAGGSVSDARAGVVRQVAAAEHFTAHPCIAEKLALLAPTPEPFIFVCHAPPHGGILDRLPNIPEPIGSRAVAAFIAARQPLMSLHGHVHESPAVTGAHLQKIGATVCVNPGQALHRLHAVMFDSANPAGTLRHTGYG
jgi:uncharacterized protein